MRKIVFGVILSVCIIVLVGCSGSPDASSNVSVSDVLNAIQSSVNSVVGIEMGTEENDLNNLLGKKNQYIELGWFMDERAIPEWTDSPEYGTDTGGTLEKFANEADAKARHEYLQSFTGILAQYSEIYGVWVIRLSNNFTASQQSELLELIKNSISELE